MGSGRWDPDAWTSHKSSVSSKPINKIFTSSSLKSNLNPHGVKVRESRDSAVNPNSTAIITGVDVTGSMGVLAETIAKEGLGTLFDEILKRKPVTDPHLMFMAIGDAYCDNSPLQVSQFEADARIIDQLKDIHVEGGGGGNHSESYNLPWYFAAMHTSIDCFEKRKKKGYLFTIGDEEYPSALTVKQIQRICGDKVQSDMSSDDLFKMASKMYHVFHLIVAEGGYVVGHGLDRVKKSWSSLGQNVMVLSDYRRLSEVIVSTIEVIEGRDRDEVINSWSGSTAITVRDAVKDLVPAKIKAGETGVVKFKR